MKVILASGSERRKELLKRIINDYEVIVPDFDETSINFCGKVDEYVKELSIAKAMEVRKKVDEPAMIIAADTVVSIDNIILGKPKDKQHAFEMLKSLSGRVHEVYTGITIINTKKDKIISEGVCTEVVFSYLSDEEIAEYIKTEEPMDKAGAYGIQGYGGVFVEKINGCYYNVVGLPLNRLSKIISQINS